MYTSARIDLKRLIISILIALGVGGLASVLTFNNMDIYKTLELPSLSPPSIVFPIVWTILYILMGISSYIVYQSDSLEKYGALKVYALQLGFNFIWSILFFNLNAFWISFIWLIILWGLIIVMIIKFKHINVFASFLQIPYLLWVTFAGYLNLMIAILN